MFNAIGFLTTVNQLSRLIAPSLAGVLIAGLGVGSAYVLVVVSIALVILVTVPMALPRSALDERPEMSPRMIVEGFSFLWNSPILLGLILLDTALTFFGAFRPLMPIFAEEVLHAGPTGLGLLLAAPGAGAVAGAAIVLFLGDRGQRERWVLWATIVYGLLLVPFGESQWLGVSMALGFALGLLDAVGATTRQTMVQVLTPDPLRGRVTSIHQMFSMGAPSLGYVQIGITASVLGTGPALIVAGILVVVCAAAIGFWWRAVSDGSRAPGYPTPPQPRRPAQR
jgi:MFS family permease